MGLVHQPITRGCFTPVLPIVAKIHEHSRKRDCLNCVGVASFVTLGILAHRTSDDELSGCEKSSPKRKVFRCH